MIVCFSGTANTRYVAKILHNVLGDEVVRVAPGFYRHPERFKLNITDGRLIWAFPTHCWGVPAATRLIMENCHVNGVGGESITHYMVTTCGDDIGNCADQWRKIMHKRNFKASTAFSVRMPNTYVFMHGFDVDSKEVEKRKLSQSDSEISKIIEVIASGEPHKDIVTRGDIPWIKTNIINPLFQKFYTNPAGFTVSEQCTGCGRCARLCPLANITMDEKTNRPVWGDLCTSCLRCYHVCPNHAIDYRHSASKKGQYVHPIFEKTHGRNDSQLPQK